MLHLSRGTYRTERRHLEDPLQPYLAPIRGLPSFHMAIEYSAEPLPVLPHVRVFYPHMNSDRNTLRGSPFGTPTGDWKVERTVNSSIGRNVLGDVRVAKRRRNSAVEEKQTKLREPRRSSVTTVTQISLTTQPFRGPEYRSVPTTIVWTGQQQPRVKPERFEDEDHLIDTRIPDYPHRTLIKREPAA